MSLWRKRNDVSHDGQNRPKLFTMTAMTDNDLSIQSPNLSIKQSKGIKVSKEALTAENVKTYFEYVPETGDLRWTDKAPVKVRCKSCQTKNSTGHKYVKFNGKNYYNHRIAWLYVYGEWPDSIDHINGDPSDNRFVNLRGVDHKTNMQNERKARSNNKTGLLGVSPNGQKYKAEIRVDGKKINLGTFEQPEVAHQAYLVAKRQMHKGATL